MNLYINSFNLNEEHSPYVNKLHGKTNPVTISLTNPQEERIDKVKSLLIRYFDPSKLEMVKFVPYNNANRVSITSLVLDDTGDDDTLHDGLLKKQDVIHLLKPITVYYSDEHSSVSLTYRTPYTKRRTGYLVLGCKYKKSSDGTYTIGVEFTYYITVGGVVHYFYELGDGSSLAEKLDKDLYGQPHNTSVVFELDNDELSRARLFNNCKLDVPCHHLSIPIIDTEYALLDNESDDPEYSLDLILTEDIYYFRHKLDRPHFIGVINSENKLTKDDRPRNLNLFNKMFVGGVLTCTLFRITNKGTGDTPIEVVASMTANHDGFDITYNVLSHRVYNNIRATSWYKLVPDISHLEYDSSVHDNIELGVDGKVVVEFTNSVGETSKHLMSMTSEDIFSDSNSEYLKGDLPDGYTLERGTMLYHPKDAFFTVPPTSSNNGKRIKNPE